MARIVVGIEEDILVMGVVEKCREILVRREEAVVLGAVMVVGKSWRSEGRAFRPVSRKLLVLAERATVESMKMR